jgi:molecular chaperone DnaJ
MNLNKDYYSILGIKKESNSDQIKTAFRKLAKEHHPDVKEGKDETKIKEINEAYTVLNDNTSRRQYDQQSKYGSNYNPVMNPYTFFGNFGNFEQDFDIFSGPAGVWSNNLNNDIFNSFFKREEFRENLDITYHTDITLKDIYNNNFVNIKYKRYIKCDTCDWTGFDFDGESFECDACDGHGHVKGRSCELCRGTGKIFTGTCKKCSGIKVILKDEEFALSNVYGIRESFDKYLKEYGHQSKHYRGKIGTMFVKVNTIMDNRYQILPSKDLLFKLDLHYRYAIDGYEFEYEHLDGKKYKIKIPSKTKDGDLLKIDGKGLIIDSTLKRADLLFKVNIVVDYNLVELAKKE